MDYIQLSNILVMPFWAMMIFLPLWRVTQRVVQSPWCVAPAATLYAALVVPGMTRLFPVLMSPTTPAIAELLGQPIGALIAWVHFLAFDLFVGRWIYLDAQEHAVPFWIVSPILFCTLMFGPFGLLVYLLLRSAAFREQRVIPAGAD